MPKALIDEIVMHLEAGLNPREVAETLGRKAGLDFGEVRSICSTAQIMERTLRQP